MGPAQSVYQPKRIGVGAGGPLGTFTTAPADVRLVQLRTGIRQARRSVAAF